MATEVYYNHQDSSSLGRAVRRMLCHQHCDPFVTGNARDSCQDWYILFQAGKAQLEWLVRVAGEEPHMLLPVLTPRLFWNNQGPGWAVDWLTHSHSQPRGHSAKEEGPAPSWAGGPGSASPAGWPKMVFPGYVWTRRSLNSSIFGNKVSYIHTNSSLRWSADYWYDSTFQEASGNHSSPHPWGPGNHWTPAFANIRPIKKGLGSIKKHTTCGKKRRKPNAHTPRMSFQATGPKLSTNGSTCNAPMSPETLFSLLRHFQPTRRGGPLGYYLLKWLSNASLRGLDIGFHGVLHSIPP